MVEPTPLKTKDDYSEHKIIKVIDGKEEEFFNIDAMTEAQWQRFCRETGTEPFRRFNVTI